LGDTTGVAPRRHPRARRGKKDGRWPPRGARGKSELRRAGCPAKAGEAGSGPSTVQSGTPAPSGVRATETNTARLVRAGLKVQSSLQQSPNRPPKTVARRGRKSRAVTEATT